MNHKRKRPKNRRAGCLLCKPHKMNGLRNAKRLLKRRELRHLQRAKDGDGES